ncbi:hypothetical protein ABZ754_16105 [Micromonospora purpureochromogenes]|uniref:hypothetical protein n=1 Tax=Micromonospora purpureochromogenes TaxID=47872 RepID=UPI0033FAB129
MRLTVGPLPSAVYWRRRAVVLGAGLLFLIVLLYSCNQSGDTAMTPGARSTPTSPAVDPSPTGSAPASAAPTATSDAPDSGGGPAGDPGTTTAPPAAPPVVPAGPTVVDDGTCTDAELSVTSQALPSEVRRGALVDLTLRVKNTAQRTCSRDVGADLQELYIKRGAEKVWSSDTCGTGKGSDVQSFTPGFERSYQLTWNGKDVSRCAGGVAAGPTPSAGTYQVFARVGTKLSEPVKLVITG